jgi:simple sugar transport system substrate-binding protein
MFKRMTTLLIVFMILSVVFSGSVLAYKFALVTHVAGTPFWVPVEKGAKEAGELLGCEVQFIGPQSFSIEKEVDYLESVISQKVDGIGVAIADAEALDKLISKARNMDIPVVAFNVDDPYTPNERMAFVGQSFTVAGNVLASNLIEDEDIPEDAEAVVLIGEPGNAALEERAAGIEQILDQEGIKSERFSAPLAEPSTGIDMLKSYIRSHPKLKIVAATEFSSVFAAQAMKELGMEPGELLIAGFDIVTDQSKMIKEGYVKFTIDQQPYLQGFQTVMLLYLYNKFGLYPTNINTGVAVVDKSSIDKVIKLSEEGYR